MPRHQRSTREALGTTIKELITLFDIYELEADFSDGEPALGTEHIDEEKANIFHASAFESDREGELGFVGTNTGWREGEGRLRLTSIRTRG